MDYSLHLGDCLETLRGMPDNSVDSVVTDPPYGLSFMGKKWDYDVPSTEIWAECLRVLKPGGHLLAFAGTRTQHRMAVRIEDAGFEIRDMLAWVYGSGFPKSRNIGNDVDGMDGWGTALKPSMEPITFARKPLSGKTIGANVREFGVGALNIDACRIATDENLNGGAYAANGSRSESHSLHGATGMNVAGKTTGKDFEQPSGRWPANLIHDGSADVVAQFPMTKSGTPGIKRGGNTGTAYGAESRAPGTQMGGFGDEGSAARFFYCAKTSRKDRNEGMTDPGPQFAHGNTLRKVENTETAGNTHPTVKPTDLMAYLLRLVTPAGGTALDPFMGSGSTGKAAMREGFRFIGCELDEKYMAIAKARIEHECSLINAGTETQADRQAELFA